MESGKVRKAFYIEEDILEQVDSLLQQADVRSRNEFVNQALRFYIGYLTSEKIENYMLSTISSVMHSTVKDSENRMARAMYKLAVETSKLSHVIAYSHGVDEETLRKLQAKCAEEVKRMIVRHGTLQTEFRGEEIAMREMRKHVAWYTAGFPHSSALRNDINQVETLEELERLVDERI